MEDLDKSFLKEVTLLYVEDESFIREEMCEVFSYFFKDVIAACDGEEALQIYKSYNKKNENIDVIISDISMPNKTGTELLEEVRNINPTIPFIFTTSHTDSSLLLDAIKYKVTSYILKPINTNNLMNEVCAYVKQSMDAQKYFEEKDELYKYLNSIDQVAIIIKSDDKGIVKYANKAFYDISNYSPNDILGKSYRSIIHPDISNRILNNIWNNAKEKKIWNGKLKYKEKDESIIYVHTTMIPILDNSTISLLEHYHISFLITNYELEKRDFKKRVIANVQENRRQNIVARKMIDDLKDELKKYGEMDSVFKSLKNEKKKNIGYLHQLKLYASKLNLNSEGVPPEFNI